jgi:hypothetical protein
VRDVVYRPDGARWGAPPAPGTGDLRELYDITLSRARLSRGAAVELLSGLVQQPELATTEAGIQLVRDRALAARVRLALAMGAATRRHRIHVEARQGVVLLDSTDIVDAAVEVAREVPHVRRVIMRDARAA